MTDEIDEGGEAPCWAHFIDELDQARPAASSAVRPVSTNTIIYCDNWSAVVDFYRRGLGLNATMERDWFVEFELQPGAHLSVADASRATVEAGTGSGLTLSWRVDDVAATRTGVIARGLDASPIRRRWNADTCFVSDPADNRIEFWAPIAQPESAPSTTPPTE